MSEPGPATYTGDLNGAHFHDASLRGARFREVDLRGAVMRGADLAGADIDAPFLLDGVSTLVINEVDVAPLIEKELNARFPGRERRRAHSRADLREAWAAVERAWGSAVAHAESLPAGTVDRTVGGEWSFAQTLRHLVMATDVWLQYAIHGVEQPFHPLGLADDSFFAGGGNAAAFTEPDPTWERVLEVRADHQRMVSDLLATIEEAELDGARRNPWDDDRAETVRSCLHTILEEEWEHLRFALRDLTAIEGSPPAS